MKKRDWKKRNADPVAMLRQVSLGMGAPLEFLGAGEQEMLARRLRIFTLTAAEPALERVNHAACHAAAKVGWRRVESIASDNEVADCEQGLQAAWDEGMDAALQYFEAPAELWALQRLVGVFLALFKVPQNASHELVVPRSLTYPGQPVAILNLEETRNCCTLLREIFGDRVVILTSPFWEDFWRTSTAKNIAERMYESRNFSDMPILADALQDAGCDNAEILSHCQGTGPHLRGCWVVDLVLGKVPTRAMGSDSRPR